MKPKFANLAKFDFKFECKKIKAKYREMDLRVAK